MARESCNLGKDEGEILKPSSPSSPSPSGAPAPSSSALPSASPSLYLKPCEESTVQSPERPTIPAKEATVVPSSRKRKLEEGVVVESSAPVRISNRCFTCRKKVGLMGFRCRCGDLFCGRHRYSDLHDCSFDYKAFGREEIAKANPVIRAAKIIKI